MQAILECHEEKKQELQKAFTTNRIRGLPYMMSGKFWDLLTPLPPCHVHKSADFVPFVCFLGTPLPLPSADVIYGSPH